MKTIRIFALICMAALTIVSCDSQGSNEEPEYEIKVLEREILFSGYGMDTLITVKDFTSPVKEIKNDADWLVTEIQDSAEGGFVFKVICSKNATANVRTSEITITFNNGDKFTLKVTQKVIDGFDDVHDSVTDQPALAPGR